MKPAARAWLRLALTPVLVLVYWQLIAASGLVSRYLLPMPADVWSSFLTLLGDGTLSRHASASLSRILVGFSVSVLAGILLAKLVAWSRVAQELLAAPLALLRMIPPLALTPLLILWLGIGSATQISIIILASFFPVFLNALEGFRRVTPEQRELARSLRLPAWRYLGYVVLPAALPSMVTGVRLGFGYSWRALIGAELIAAASGLGYLIIDAQEMQRTDVVMVGILVIGLLGWAMDAGFKHGMARLFRRRFPEIAA